jgi:hypothetical protein
MSGQTPHSTAIHPTTGQLVEQTSPRNFPATDGARCGAQGSELAQFPTLTGEWEVDQDLLEVWWSDKFGYEAEVEQIEALWRSRMRGSRAGSPGGSIHPPPSVGPS